MLNPFFSSEGYESIISHPVQGELHGFFSSENMRGGGIENLCSCSELYSGGDIEKGVSIPVTNMHSFQALSSVSPEIKSLESFSRPMEAYQDLERPSCSNMRRERVDKETTRINGKKELSTEETVKVAAAHFIHLSALVEGDRSKIKLPFGLSLSTLADCEDKNVELVSLLTSGAEKVNNQQIHEANNILKQCFILSSNTGSPVKRVVYYLANALLERINRETGRLSRNEPQRRGTMTPQDAIKSVLSSHPVHLASSSALPFAKTLHFTAIQAILDNIQYSNG